MRVHVKRKKRLKEETYNNWIGAIKKGILYSQRLIFIPDREPIKSYLINHRKIKKLIRKYNLEVMFIPYHDEGYLDSTENRFYI